jgi:hypothetical protein
MTMKIGPYCIEPARPAGISGECSLWPEKTAAEHVRRGFVWLVSVLVMGFVVWMMLSGPAGHSTESEPVTPAPAAAPSPATHAAQDGQSFNAATAEAITPAQTAPVDGLKISSQSWRRGGLGSNALVSFTLRNGNDYAVRDIGISCVFARRDGSHLTDRMRTIQDTVNMKSRKTFARMHIGFVNVNANKAKCSLVSASHI